MLLALFLGFACGFDMIGWFVNYNGSEMTPQTFPFELYSHVVVGSPIVSDTGVATCNSSDPILKQFV
jgi:hypothetical protein